jgi:hypothetical protein
MMHLVEFIDPAESCVTGAENIEAELDQSDDFMSVSDREHKNSPGGTAAVDPKPSLSHAWSRKR